ncbi:abortive infection family protein [Bacillus haynesii]|uniref:abortive infection family protein n=1 Tax=Bacillus haynesii TaxID=1925021 RepID=UPI0035DBAC94
MPLEQDNEDTVIKGSVSGLNKIVQGINEIRNISGDGHTRTKNPNKHHAVLVVNSAKTVVSFLFDTYQYQLDRGTLKQYKKV